MKTGSNSISVIGPGVRVEGTVTFTGYLRVQGDVLGDVTCTSESDGTVAVHKTGNLTGAVKAPHLVVSGHVTGPVQSSATIEIHEGASVVGDAVYRQLDVHAGGVINGLLTPVLASNAAPAQAADHSASQRSEAQRGLEESVPAVAGQRASLGRPARIAAAAALLAAVVIAVVVWVGRTPSSVVAEPSVVAMPEVRAAAKSPPPPAPSQPTAPVVLAPPVEPKLPVTPLAAPVAAVKPAPVAAKTAAMQSPASSAPAPASSAPVPVASDTVPFPDKIVTVEGLNSDKPADVFFVSSRQPSVLYKRKRADAGTGSRIEIRRGAKIRIAIGDDEVFRVGEGSSIDVYYQGRKVTPRIVASGVWMNFVPLGANAAAEPN